MPRNGRGVTTIPRNGSNVYSPPADTLATTLTTIKSPNYNAFVNDVAADLNLARPIVSGGTGATSVVSAQAALSLDNKVVYASKSSGYTALATDNNASHRFTASATVSLTAAATLGANWHYTVTAAGGDVTIDPNGSETIDGLTTILVPNGTSRQIICDGTAFYTSLSALSKWELIGDYTLSAVAQSAVTNLSAFRKLRLSGYLEPSVNGSSLGVQVSTDNGSTWVSSAGQYGYSAVTGNQSTVTAGGGTNTIAILAGGVDNVANNGCDFVMEIENFNKAQRTKFLHRSSYASSNLLITNLVANECGITTAKNALRLIPSSGTITGTLTVEGVRG